MDGLGDGPGSPPPIGRLTVRLGSSAPSTSDRPAGYVTIRFTGIERRTRLRERDIVLARDAGRALAIDEAEALTCVP